MMTDTADEPVARSFTSQRLKLNYVDWGNDAAPTVILLHGGRDHARSWDAVAHGLSAEWHVVAPDLRGHGDSAWSPDGAYTSPYLVCDLAALVEHLGRETVTIVAHSLGGVVALRYAALFPERVAKVAAIEGIGLSPPGGPVTLETKWRGFVEERLAQRARRPRRYTTLADALARMRAENPHLNEAQARHLTLHGTTENEDGSYSWKFDTYIRTHYPVDLTNDEQRALWRRIECPVWLVHGADSWAKHPNDAGRADEFRDARVTSFAQAGHWVHHDRTDAFNAELRKFLAG